MTVAVCQVGVLSVQETFQIKANHMGCDSSHYPQSQTLLKSYVIHSPRGIFVCSFVCAEMVLPVTKSNRRVSI